MKIGIIGAMKSEVEALKDALSTFRKETKASMEFCEGKLGQMDVVVVQSGIGKVNAGICAQVSFEEFEQKAAKNSSKLVQYMLENW